MSRRGGVKIVVYFFDAIRGVEKKKKEKKAKQAARKRVCPHGPDPAGPAPRAAATALAQYI